MEVKEVIVMGNIVETYYSDNILETIRINRHRESLQRCASWMNDDQYIDFDYKEKLPEVVKTEKFKEYAEVSRNNKIDSGLKIGDFIYIPKDNRSYKIENVATDIDGNIVYFIDKVVSIVESENIEESKRKAQKRIEEWISENEAEKEESYHKGLIEKEVKKMDKWWRLGRNFD